MRNVLLFVFLFVVSFVRAQELQIETDSVSIDAVFDACVAMQEAIENNDTTALVAAGAKYRDAAPASFSDLHSKDTTNLSLKGHFVFNDVFVDSLAAGKDAYANSDSINLARENRGQMPSGRIFTKTCVIKAGKSMRYTFTSSNRLELGLITEPGGRVYVRVHATNTKGLDVRYNDDKNAVKGTRRYRKAFDLPSKPRSTVELEVINRGKDTSFVVIRN